MEEEETLRWKSDFEPLILASDDEEDEEHVARRRRTRTQIERDLNNPKVHKRIVENLYFAYKMRVRRRRRRRRRLAFSLEFSSPKTKPFHEKAFDVLSRSWGVGFERSRPPPPPPAFPRTILWVVSLNDGRRPRSQRSDVPLRRARARASIDRSIDAIAPRRARERKNDLERSARDLSRWGKGRDRHKRRRGDFSFFDLADFFLRVLGRVCVCVCSKTDPLPRAKNSPLSLSLSRTIPLARARLQKNERRTTSRCSRSFSSCVSTSRFSSYREKRERRIDSRRR